MLRQATWDPSAKAARATVLWTSRDGAQSEADPTRDTLPKALNSVPVRALFWLTTAATRKQGKTLIRQDGDDNSAPTLERRMLYACTL
jgi:hypothetical protein